MDKKTIMEEFDEIVKMVEKLRDMVTPQSDGEETPQTVDAVEGVGDEIENHYQK